MPLHESEAIVLRSYPLAEADRLVSFLSRTMGRVRGVAAGARKDQKPVRFDAAERLSHVRIWYYEKETRDLVRISQCEMIESFSMPFSDYARASCWRSSAKSPKRCCRSGKPSDANFRLLLLARTDGEAHAEDGASAGLLRLWTVKLGGWLPAFDRLRANVAAFDGREHGLFFASALGRFCAELPPVRNAGSFSARKWPRRKCSRSGWTGLSRGFDSPVAAREITDGHAGCPHRAREIDESLHRDDN
jgi:DNA repair protein RecO (recombination protein O)